MFVFIFVSVVGWWGVVSGQRAGVLGACRRGAAQRHGVPRAHAHMMRHHASWDRPTHRLATAARFDSDTQCAEDMCTFTCIYFDIYSWYVV